MATSKGQRVLSFLMALFFFGSSIVAVFFTIRQIHEDNKTNSDLAKTASASPTPGCAVKAEFATKEGDDPGEIQKVESEVTGLQSTDIKEGTGVAAALNDCITVHYRLYLADGTPVEGNDTFATKQPVAFKLAEGGLIKGWTDGIPGMKVGGIRRLVLPAELGYGATGSCKTYDQSDSTKCTAYSIPPNSVLVFDIELLDVSK